MKITKKLLNEHNIFNSYNLAQVVGSKIFIDYIPADNGRLTSRYAYWKYTRLAETGYYHKDFTVTHREAKEPKLQEAIAYVKSKHGINITDKDIFGAYHPEGTLNKLQEIISNKESSIVKGSGVVHAEPK